MQRQPTSRRCTVRTNNRFYSNTVKKAAQGSRECNKSILHTYSYHIHQKLIQLSVLNSGMYREMLISLIKKVWHLPWFAIAYGITIT